MVHNLEPHPVREIRSIDIAVFIGPLHLYLIARIGFRRINALNRKIIRLECRDFGCDLFDLDQIGTSVLGDIKIHIRVRIPAVPLFKLCVFFRKDILQSADLIVAVLVRPGKVIGDKVVNNRFRDLFRRAAFQRIRQLLEIFFFDIGRIVSDDVHIILH